MTVQTTPERRAVAVAVAALAALAVADALAGERLVLIGTFGVVPLVASAFVAARQTGLLGGLAVAAGFLAGVPNDIFLTRDHLTRCAVVATLSVVATWLAGRRVAREERLRQVTAVADVAQRAVLRTIPTAVGRLAFAARYLSAAKSAHIGGDLYEVAATPFGVRVIVGDVRGKGLEAVQLAAVVLGSFRQVAYSAETLVDLAHELDASVSRVVQDEDFVTAVLLEFQDDGTFALVNAGHHAPLLVSAGVLQLLDLDAPSPPFGLVPDFTVQSHRLDVGSRLLLYTDGLVEARSAGGSFYRIEQAAAGLEDCELEACLDRLVDELLVHTGGDLGDDLALVLAERRSER